MTQRAWATHYTGTPSEDVIVFGKEDSGRYLEVVIPATMAVEIIVQGAKAYSHCHHMGHALWHVQACWMDDEDFVACDTCRRIQEET